MADGSPSEHVGDPVALRSGYEQLRDAVVSGRPDGWRLGHGVLATRGTVAWIGAVTEVASSPHAPGHAPGPRPVPALPGASEIVAVLAQMALAHAA